MFIDEADYLSRNRGRHDLLDVARDIYDESGSSIIFISVTHLAKRLAAPAGYRETVTSRIGARVKFERASIADATLLARELLEGVEFDRDVVTYCVHDAAGSLRVLLNRYAEIEKLAQAAGVDRVSLATLDELRRMADMPTVDSAAKPASQGEIADPAPALKLVK